MATQKYTTLGSGALNSSYTAGATSLVLQTGQGATFPTTGDFVVAVDDPPAFFLKCTARSGDTLTVATSAVDGTTAVNKGSGVTVTEVITATVLDGIRADMHQTGRPRRARSRESRQSVSAFRRAATLARYRLGNCFMGSTLPSDRARQLPFRMGESGDGLDRHHARGHIDLGHGRRYREYSGAGEVAPQFATVDGDDGLHP
jgi:hypothetical protein